MAEPSAPIGTPAGSPLGPRPDLRWVAVAVAAAGLGAVALASRGSGVFGGLQDGTSPLGSTAARAALGAVGGLALAAGVVAVLRVTNPRHRLVDAAPVRPRWGRVVRWSLPIAILMAALGAAAGAATAPLRPPDAAPPAENSTSSGSRAAMARYVDFDGDGEPDVDAQGRRIVAVDMSGDGDFDAVLRPCPAASGAPVTDEGDDGTEYILIDQGCDGEVDYRIRLTEGLVRDLGTDRSGTEGGGQSQGTGTPPVDRSPDLGGALRAFSILLIVAGVLLAAVLVHRALRQRRAGPSGVATPLPRPPVPPGALDRAAAAATVEDAIAAMLADPDPRTAIRAAYATLLDGLADAGLPRHAYEAPAEHLERCLTALAVRPEPMRHLVDVFSMARFSTHPVTEAHRTSALDALRTAQTDLAHAPLLAGVGA